jgi:hypothetical protein
MPMTHEAWHTMYHVVDYGMFMFWLTRTMFTQVQQKVAGLSLIKPDKLVPSVCFADNWDPILAIPSALSHSKFVSLQVGPNCQVLLFPSSILLPRKFDPTISDITFFRVDK